MTCQWKIRAKKREAFFPAINFKQALVDFRTKLFPRYDNLNPIKLADVPHFFEKEFDSFLEYPLNKISTYLTFPYGEKNYVISMYVDLVTKKYTLSVVIPTCFYLSKTIKPPYKKRLITS